MSHLDAKLHGNIIIYDYSRGNHCILWILFLKYTWNPASSLHLYCHHSRSATRLLERFLFALSPFPPFTVEPEIFLKQSKCLFLVVFMALRMKSKLLILSPYLTQSLPVSLASWKKSKVCLRNLVFKVFICVNSWEVFAIQKIYAFPFYSLSYCHIYFFHNSYNNLVKNGFLLIFFVSVPWEQIFH